MFAVLVPVPVPVGVCLCVCVCLCLCVCVCAVQCALRCECVYVSVVFVDEADVNPLLLSASMTWLLIFASRCAAGACACGRHH